MPRAKVVEFDYYQFIGLMRRATDTGARIDKSDSARWADYVKKNNVNEIAATAIAKQKFEGATPVIIDEGLDTDGLYFYSKNEETCLKLITIE
jgi:hypothetical protein